MQPKTHPWKTHCELAETDWLARWDAVETAGPGPEGRARLTEVECAYVQIVRNGKGLSPEEAVRIGARLLDDPEGAAWIASVHRYSDLAAAALFEGRGHLLTAALGRTALRVDEQRLVFAFALRRILSADAQAGWTAIGRILDGDAGDGLRVFCMAFELLGNPPPPEPARAALAARIGRHRKDKDFLEAMMKFAAVTRNPGDRIRFLKALKEIQPPEDERLRLKRQLATMLGTPEAYDDFFRDALQAAQKRPQDLWALIGITWGMINIRLLPAEGRNPAEDFMVPIPFSLFERTGHLLMEYLGRDNVAAAIARVRRHLVSDRS